MINKNLPIIIDSDGGADDAFAIMAAHSLFKNKICLMLATYGNYTLDTVTENLASIMSLANINAPLIRTSSEAIDKVLCSPNVCEPFYKTASCFPKGTEAKQCDDFVDYIYTTLQKYKKVNYVALGPLSNVALLLRRYPDACDYIDSFIMMGGGIDLHNITDYAEYNIYCDPFAAKEVYESKLSIYMAGLRVCQRSQLTGEQIEQIIQNAGSLSAPVRKLFEIEEYYSKSYGNPIGIIYDAATSIYMACPEIFETEKTGIDIMLDSVHFGQTVKTDKRNNVTLLTDVIQTEFANALLNAIKNL